MKIDWEAETIKFINKASLLEIIFINLVRYKNAHGREPPLMYLTTSLRGQLVREVATAYPEMYEELRASRLHTFMIGPTQVVFRSVMYCYIKLVDQDLDIEMTI